MNPFCTHLENSVLDLLLSGSSSTLAKLRTQIAESSVSRTHTGVGFWLDLHVPDTCPLVLPRTFQLTDVAADIMGLEYGAGFVLFIDGGKAVQLEGFSYDEPWPEKIDSFTVKYISAERSLPFEDRTKR